MPPLAHSPALALASIIIPCCRRVWESVAVALSLGPQMHPHDAQAAQTAWPGCLAPQPSSCPVTGRDDPTGWQAMTSSTMVTGRPQRSQTQLPVTIKHKRHVAKAPFGVGSPQPARLRAKRRHPRQIGRQRFFLASETRNANAGFHAAPIPVVPYPPCSSYCQLSPAPSLFFYFLHLR